MQTTTASAPRVRARNDGGPFTLYYSAAIIVWRCLVVVPNIVFASQETGGQRGVPMVRVVGQPRRVICVCLTCIFLVSPLAACSSWQVQRVAPREFRTRDAAQPVRIVRLNGTYVTLTGARVSGDSLYGTPVLAVEPNVVLAIPLSDIQEIVVRQGDGEKTIYLVIGIVALTAVTLYGVFLLILSTDPS